jgi:PPK2 family polyphosphate:nucleotide phosphotransferase
MDVEQFRVAEGARVDLSHRPTQVAPAYRDDDHARQLLDEQVERTSEMQDLLYANNTWSLLVIFQAMDAAGKDGAIKHVMTGVNPVGCQVTSFKQPSAEELDHDFLWRAARALPERGRIGLFNRSYYEEVLVVRVHPELLQRQGLPPELVESKRIWSQRYQSILDFEAHLQRNGTRVVKFFLHVSKEEQRLRFLDRIDHPEKNWKFQLGDVAERQHWDEYREAYEHCLTATSTTQAPWYVVPADDKKNARLIMSQVINQTLAGLHLSYPQLDKARREELQSSRKLLER